MTPRVEFTPRVKYRVLELADKPSYRLYTRLLELSYESTSRLTTPRADSTRFLELSSLLELSSESTSRLTTPRADST